MWVHAPEPNQILPLWNILRYILNCFYCKDISSRVEGNGTFTVQINSCKVNKIITRTSRHHTLSNWPLNRGKSNCYTIKSNRPWIISQPTFLLWRDAHLEYAMSYFKLSVPLSQTFFLDYLTDMLRCCLTPFSRESFWDVQTNKVEECHSCP